MDDNRKRSTAMERRKMLETRKMMWPIYESLLVLWKYNCATLEKQISTFN